MPKLVSILEFAYRIGFTNLYDWQARILLRYTKAVADRSRLRQLQRQDFRRLYGRGSVDLVQFPQSAAHVHVGNLAAGDQQVFCRS